MRENKRGALLKEDCVPREWGGTRVETTVPPHFSVTVGTRYEKCGGTREKESVSYTGGGEQKKWKNEENVEELCPGG